MSIKDSLKPDRYKVITSLAGMVVWVVKLITWDPICPKIEGPLNCASDYSQFALYETCFGCMGLTDLLLQYLVGLIIPFVAIYLLFSIGQYLVYRIRNNNR